MKSAEEWLNAVGEVVMFSAFVGGKPPGHEVENLIRAIQADAMREAANMVRRAPTDSAYDGATGVINRVNMADTIADKAQQLEQNEQ